MKKLIIVSNGDIWESIMTIANKINEVVETINKYETLDKKNRMALTKRQHVIYQMIKDHVDTKGYFPTLRELAEMIGTKNVSTAQYFVDLLEEKGWLNKVLYENP